MQLIKKIELVVCRHLHCHHPEQEDRTQSAKLEYAKRWSDLCVEIHYGRYCELQVLVEG